MQPDPLTLTHKQAQAAVRKRTVLALLATWGVLDITDIDGTIERWLTAAAPVVKSGYNDSVRLAAAYLKTYRKTQVAGRPFPPVRPTFDETAARRSLLTRGPLLLKTMTSTSGLTMANLAAQAAQAEAGSRVSLIGGRLTITQTTAADPASNGWERVASSNACSFCQKLSGLVTSERFEAHDSCNCTAQPSYLF